jgi:hypothetical protein
MGVHAKVVCKLEFLTGSQPWVRVTVGGVASMVPGSLEAWELVLLAAGWAKETDTQRQARALPTKQPRKGVRQRERRNERVGWTWHNRTAGDKASHVNSGEEDAPRRPASHRR